MSGSSTATVPIALTDFEHRHAAHCESGTVATLLRTRGLDLSEAMVFGVGGGFFFLYLPWLKMGGMPLTAYRDAPRCIIKNVCKRLGVRMKSQRFRDPDAGMRALDALLAQGIPVGLQTNIFWLPYFPDDMRFQYNGHNMVVYGKRGDDYLISDPVTDHTVTCPADALRRARFAKGVFAPRGLLYYPEFVPATPDLERVLPFAIRTTAKRMVDIPIPMFGVRGIRFLARHLESWPARYGVKKANALVGNVVRMQEEIGTGGAGFRFLYSAFLQEAGQHLQRPEWIEAAAALGATGDRWRDFAILGAQLVKGRETADSAYRKLADMLRECAAQEEQIFTRLKTALK
jgi:hypothetical protein